MQFSISALALAMACISQVGEVASIPVGAEVEARELDKRDQYTHCACQVSSNSGIDSFTTSRVVGFNDYRWKLDVRETQRGEWGARFTGYYVYAKSGFVDGKAFYNECLQNGAGDSTCFGRQ
ncbi:hypothetical protein COCC4DRAFT_18786 [Bipolaris maydis ATCC 48331]|uniref:Uncharacterized protein n=2 Tax=Cochliobolus heterostrophus TaxID=5016 RepID=M2UQP8_COCH5|nr:uncharacterized protein COCC4DRAFT_18786 [Bipolaris maydis ATCC 48331]EMD95896.1 hypothetical protein COCHEDRAFT_1210159 [Bipolaris maydis C5]KAJ5030605.1 hypothetical protein J3E73DRAFT_365945 [Bipolaris maydis]ENI10755.1 hypothetical protein COCC4DRAFT_18786 [Bipolaris maydis ATCC 48331]KAJ6200824.1 hypothetical protein J3E72DRAFT_392620 [Bipolaris maydis]KAJ6213321.1 hypothetical protein PSV09DRAFT_1210159 [Bipolaris maydis]